MNINETAEKVKNQWKGPGDNRHVMYALETSRTNGDRETVDQNWRWLTDDLNTFYDLDPDFASATFNFIGGWISGATSILNKALLTAIDR